MGYFCGVICKNRTGAHHKIEWVKSKSLTTHPEQSYLEDDGYFFGIIPSDVVPQSVYEKGAIYDSETSIILLADAELENRDELFVKLNIEDKEISDTELILIAYKEWGENCVNDLLGEFAIVAYNTLSHEIYCAIDQLGKRMIYYVDHEDYFAFSSNMTSLFPMFDPKPRLNDFWIANYLSLDGPVHAIVEHETVYKDIYKLESGNIFKVQHNRQSLSQYWQEEIREEVTCSFEDAYEGLCDVLSNSVRNKIMTRGNVGSYLSGGLDSSSVAALANKHLKEENKPLYGYSAVPLSKYNFKKESKYYIFDESDYIDSLTEKEDNIVHHYITCEDKNPVTDLEKHLYYLEHPYKFIQNFYWLDGIIREAQKDNCKILLSGGYGNCTISYGEFYSYIATLISDRKYLRAITSIEDFSSFMGVSKKPIVKYILKSIVPYTKDSARNKGLDFDKLIVNEGLAKKYHIEEYQREQQIGQYLKRNLNGYDYRKLYLSNFYLSQVNSLNTGAYSKYGVQLKDPTLDVKVIEYCYSMPLAYYVYQGKERELIRQAMKDLLPDKIRNNYTKRGYQSVDWARRLEDSIKRIEEELIHYLDDDVIGSYIQKRRILTILKRLPNDYLKCDTHDIWALVVTYVFCKFIDAYKNY